MSAELLEMANELEAVAKKFEAKHKETLRNLTDAAAAVQNSWSGSNIGYHALVYYEGLAERPPGAQFSIEWGLMDTSFIDGSVGAWHEYPASFVKDAIYERAGHPDLSGAKNTSDLLTKLVNREKDEFLSILAVAQDDGQDEILDRLKNKVQEVRIQSYDQMCRALLPSGQIISRDSNAVMTGIRIAPHQEIIAETAALQHPCLVALELSEIAKKAHAHMSRKQKVKQHSKQTGRNVFIGHGRSTLWRELKDFIVDRLELPYEEFNRVPVAGVTNIARLSEMLDNAGCALILLTAEDERVDGSLCARMNVIHEAGLFQGRLGFTKAIVVLEDTCEEFSNIQGLGQIRFPKGNISAAFEQIRAVFEREEMI